MQNFFVALVLLECLRFIKNKKQLRFTSNVTGIAFELKHLFEPCYSHTFPFCEAPRNCIVVYIFV